MKDTDIENLPKNPIEAQGMLIKAFYKKFGKDALSIIKEVCKKQGKSLGLKIKKKLPNNNLSTVATAFSKSYNPNDIKVVEISDIKFQIQGNKCPFGLDILKTVADGDESCETIYNFKNKEKK